jgi:hypothetical protein
MEITAKELAVKAVKELLSNSTVFRLRNLLTKMHEDVEESFPQFLFKEHSTALYSICVMQKIFRVDLEGDEPSDDFNESNFLSVFLKHELYHPKCSESQYCFS